MQRSGEIRSHVRSCFLLLTGYFTSVSVSNKSVLLEDKEDDLAEHTATLFQIRLSLSLAGWGLGSSCLSVFLKRAD